MKNCYCIVKKYCEVLRSIVEKYCGVLWRSIVKYCGEVFVKYWCVTNNVEEYCEELLRRSILE